MFSNDPLRPHCREILEALQQGTATGWVDVLVVHELTYALGRTNLPAFDSRQGIVEYIRRILILDSVLADSKDELLETLELWGRRHIGFADARLSVLARQRGMHVCSPNQRDFEPGMNSFGGG